MLLLFIMNFKNLNLLITGGCGFIGSNFCNYISDKVNKLVIIDKITYAADINNISNIIENENVFLIIDDIVNHNFLNTFEEYDINYIIHFAAETHVDTSYIDVIKYINNNIIATYKILDSILKYKDIPMIYFSTDEVYGESNDQYKYKESDMYNPTNPYAATKASCELIIKSFINSYNMSIMIVRCNNIYGINQYKEKVIPKFIKKALNNETIELDNEGKIIRDFVYIDDLIDALLILINNGNMKEIYNIGYANPISIANLANTIIELTNSKSDKIYTKNRPYNDYRYYIDNSKILKLGWKPKYNNINSFKENIKYLIKYDNRKTCR